MFENTFRDMAYLVAGRHLVADFRDRGEIPYGRVVERVEINASLEEESRCLREFVKRVL